jgi:hypothetical protein
LLDQLTRMVEEAQVASVRAILMELMA